MTEYTITLRIVEDGVGTVDVHLDCTPPPVALKGDHAACLADLFYEAISNLASRIDAHSKADK